MKLPTDARSYWSSIVLVVKDKQADGYIILNTLSLMTHLTRNFVSHPIQAVSAGRLWRQEDKTPGFTKHLYSVRRLVSMTFQINLSLSLGTGGRIATQQPAVHSSCLREEILTLCYNSRPAGLLAYLNYRIFGGLLSEEISHPVCFPSPFDCSAKHLPTKPTGLL